MISEGSRNKVFRVLRVQQHQAKAGLGNNSLKSLQGVSLLLYIFFRGEYVLFDPLPGKKVQSLLCPLKPSHCLSNHFSLNVKSV